MNKKNLRQEKGITLIALVITIIVMLILVAVTATIAVNGGLFNYARKAGVETNEAKDAEQEYATLRDGMSTGDLIGKYTGGWYQKADGTFTNGKSTVAIGDYINYNCYPGTIPISYESLETVSGYSNSSHKQTYTTPATEDECKAIKWRILGAEDGDLLVVMDTPLTNYYLGGAEGYQNGIGELNNISAIYGHGANAVEGKTRSINVDDINKITGYDPKTAVTIDGQKYPQGYTAEGSVATYGNKVTYYVNTENNNKISYRSTYQNADSPIQTFIKLGEQQGILAGEEVNLENTSCGYSMNLVTDANIRNFLSKSYWLATTYTYPNVGYAGWSMHRMYAGWMGGTEMWSSISGSQSKGNGVRPVVYLSSDIKLKAGTAINNINAWDFDTTE